MDMFKAVAVKAIRIVQRIWILLVIVLLVGGILLYRKTTAPIPEIVTYTVKQEDLQDILGLSGEVDASEKATLHFQSGGRLSWVGVKEGDEVKKYDGLASLDQRQLQKSIEKYLNTYSKERRDFEQSHDTLAEDSLSMTREVRDAAVRSLENAQFDLNNSVLDVELQTISKEYAYLYTPIAGIVTRVDVPQAGANVSIADIFEVVNPESLFFSIAVDQTDVIKIREGMTGTITLDAYPDLPMKGTISSISFTPKAGESGTVYEAEMSFVPSLEMQYRLGMTGDVDFVIDEIKNTTAIPIDYAYDENGKTYVNKDVSGKPVKTMIEIGSEFGGEIQVLVGLQPGDVIYEVTD
ncbi:efflux RND transporter periplasmic adaptor subunit [Candidatus Woesebacteria bacterium]|nr:efflux RND transporter periplasmic adaptor subunit [Candidatus Woesebacteria bacterium]